ncbi:hypothetical protein PMZ80_009600 [Knufia obscura]|uniref:Carnosine N-methyltransferase n=1 Tax=Knufia obscura TaxID=1635080 RepID=A0ABR0RBJ3_9EURO|nr:hypothetical protein PMZ80_009600 [Knufia obscura]
MWSILFNILTVSAVVLGIHAEGSARESFPAQEIVVSHVTTIHAQAQPITVSRHENQRAQLLHQLDSGAIKGESKSLKQRVLEALYGFESYHHEELERYESLYQNVPRRQKKILDTAIGYGHTFHELKQSQSVNEAICREIVEAALTYYGISRTELETFVRQERAANRNPDRESVSQALKLFVRDWALEGHNEREDSFPCINSYLRQYFEVADNGETDSVEVLVPGSGLGRLAHEIADLSAHFLVTANEWSSFVNAAYHYLETITTAHSVSMYPFIELWSHLKTKKEMRRKVSFPDVPVNTSQVLLVEGDFTRVFKESSSGFDAIVTLFFIDTARNLMAYFEAIN